LAQADINGWGSLAACCHRQHCVVERHILAALAPEACGATIVVVNDIVLSMGDRPARRGLGAHKTMARRGRM